jgi:CspA family cold shock protein
MPQGIVKKYMADRGFGFIRPDGGGDDVFFHVKSLPMGTEPREGARVDFEVGSDRKTGKPQARNVRILRG